MRKFWRRFLFDRWYLLVVVLLPRLLLRPLSFLSSNNPTILRCFPDGPIVVTSWVIGTVISDNPTRRLYTSETVTSAKAQALATKNKQRLATRRRLKSFASISSTTVFSSAVGTTFGEESTNSTSSTAAAAAAATRIATALENPAAGNSNGTEKSALETIESERSLCQKSSSEVKIHRLPGVRRIHCISDLHVDSPDNLEWLKSKCQCQPTTMSTSIGNATTSTGDSSNNKWDETDLIVVAGDISHEMDRIEASLTLLLETGAHVVFVPGNHEAWLTSRDYLSRSQQQQQQQQQYSSATKLEDIEKLCRKLGVYTTGECVCVEGSGCDDSLETTAETEEFWILPLDSWYDGSLSFVDLNDAPSNNEETEDDFPPGYDLVRDFGKWPWVDFRECQWPSWFFAESSDSETKSGETHTQQSPLPLHQRSRLLRKIPIGLVDYYLQRNQKVIDAFHDAVNRKSPTNSTASEEEHEQSESNPISSSNNNKKTSVMTVTHFLPNQQSLPDWKDLESPTFRIDSWLDHGAGGTSAKFALVGGSSKIDDQIRSLSLVPENSNIDATDEESSDSELPNDGFHQRIHVFGHSHRPKDFVYEGIRYVHNPLGKPRERAMHMVDPNVEIKLLWEAGRTIEHETLLRYWEERGGGLEIFRKRLKAQKRNRKLLVRQQRQQRQQEQQQQTSDPIEK